MLLLCERNKDANKKTKQEGGKQTFVDTYSRVAICKLYTEKTAITAADHLDDRVIPFFESYNIPLVRVLTHDALAS